MAPASSRLIAHIRDLRNRHQRVSSGTFYAEGNRIVAQAVAAGMTVELAVVAPELVTSDLVHATVADLRARGVPVHEMRVDDFNRLSFKRNPSGLGAVVHGSIATLDGLTPDGGLGWVALDGVGNAGNLGAILRTTDAVGCDGVILIGDTTDPYHPDTVRASMGAIFSQRLVQASWPDFVAWKRRTGVPVVGTSGDARADYRGVAYPLPLVLMMGSERLGLSAEQQALCDLVVRIPMVGTGDSLNLSVATGIILYELFHQQQSRAAGDPAG